MADINYWYFAIPAATVALVYIIRRIRVWQWGHIRNRYSLAGKTYIVTGANTGLGFETTRALVKHDATVIMACRSIERADKAIGSIRKETIKGTMIACHLDLASFESIVDFVQNIKENYPNFTTLINNAGLAMPDSKQKTVDGIELHFGTNHLGHFLLTRLLQDRIQTNRARVVVVSSLLHQRGRIDFTTIAKCVERNGIISKANNLLYNNSKLANFYHARELYKRGFDVHSLCPIMHLFLAKKTSKKIIYILILLFEFFSHVTKIFVIFTRIFIASFIVLSYSSSYLMTILMPSLMR